MYLNDEMYPSHPRLPIMGGKASSDELGGNAVHWIIQSSTAVLKYSVVPRHDILDGVAVSVDDA